MKSVGYEQWSRIEESMDGGRKYFYICGDCLAEVEATVAREGADAEVTKQWWYRCIYGHPWYRKTAFERSQISRRLRGQILVKRAAPSEEGSSEWGAEVGSALLPTIFL